MKTNTKIDNPYNNALSCGFGKVIPLVSIIVTTYNHQDYIAEALNSALIQQGNFEKEILVSDDLSEDATRDVLKQFTARYTEIKDISGDCHEGISGNMRKCISMARGKYIAFLEGDDLWINPFKIESQIQFMRSNPMCKMCFTDSYFLRQDDFLVSEPDNQQELDDKLTGDIIIERNNPVITFSSTLFSAPVLKSLPELFYSIPLSEFALALYCDNFDSIGHINTKSVLYRQHATSAWSSLSTKNKLLSGIRARELAKKICRPQYIPLLDKSIEERRVELSNLQDCNIDMNK